jgi:hypothetical protein
MNDATAIREVFHHRLAVAPAYTSRRLPWIAGFRYFPQVDNRRVLLLCAWSAPVLIVLLGTGIFPVAGLVPPPSPSDSAETIQRFFSTNAGSIRVGMVMVMIGSAGFIPWTIRLGHQLKQPGRDSSIVTHIQTASGVIACLVGVNFSMITSLAAFRPDDIAPETTRMLDDWMWFWWLIPWPPFFVWMLIMTGYMLRGADRTAAAPVEVAVG